MKKYILYLFCLVGVLSGCEKKDDPTITNPIIKSIEPSVGMAGSEVLITGTNFDLDTTKVSIMVDGQRGKIKKISSNSVTAILPTGLTPGPKKIVLIQSGYTNSDLEFEIYELPQNITIESTTALIGDKVKIVVNDLNPKLTCKITGIIDGKEIEAEQGTSSNEFFISIPQAGSVELRLNTISIKGISLTVYEPGDLLTATSWTIDKVDLSIGNPKYLVKNYEGIMGKFVFNKDGSYTQIENGKETKGTWKIEKNLNFSTDKYVIRLKETENYWFGFLRESYSELEKMTSDSLIFNFFGTLVRLIPSDKVPIAQEIPNSTIEELLTRPKLWANENQKGNTFSIGLDLKFLVSSSLWVHFTYGDFKEREWFWTIKNESGKNILKITQIGSNGIPYVTPFEIEEINFNKLVLKDSQNYKGYYRPRYW